MVKIWLRWFKRKCLNDQERRFSEHSIINHPKNLLHRCWRLVFLFNEGSPYLLTISPIFTRICRVYLNPEGIIETLVGLDPDFRYPRELGLWVRPESYGTLESQFETSPSTEKLRPQSLKSVMPRSIFV